jgi:hypothetical protein
VNLLERGARLHWHAGSLASLRETHGSVDLVRAIGYLDEPLVGLRGGAPFLGIRGELPETANRVGVVRLALHPADEELEATTLIPGFREQMREAHRRVALRSVLSQPSCEHPRRLEHIGKSLLEDARSERRGLIQIRDALAESSKVRSLDTWAEICSERK